MKRDFNTCFCAEAICVFHMWLGVDWSGSEWLGVALSGSEWLGVAWSGVLKMVFGFFIRTFFGKVDRCGVYEWRI